MGMDDKEGRPRKLRDTTVETASHEWTRPSAGRKSDPIANLCCAGLGSQVKRWQQGMRRIAAASVMRVWRSVDATQGR
nr:hypothetical protein CFP56_57841 [Quercus suber]